MKLGFTRSEADPNLYFKVENDKPLILVLYVDDLFLTGANPLIDKCKRELDSKFEMKNLGSMHYFVGLEVWQKPGEIFLSEKGRFPHGRFSTVGNIFSTSKPLSLISAGVAGAIGRGGFRSLPTGA